MKEQTEQKIREYLEQFRIQFTGEEKPGSSFSLAEIDIDCDDTASEVIFANICNIIEKEEKPQSGLTESKSILEETINQFPEGDRYVIDPEKVKYIREDIVLKIIDNFLITK